MESENSSSKAASNPLSIALVVVAVVFAFALLPRLIRPSQSPLVDKPAPAFDLPVLANSSGSSHLALGSLKGKVVIADFWASWCGPCRAQSPILDAMQKRLSDRGLVVVGVNVKDSQSQALEWAQGHSISYPILFDADGKASDDFGVENLPTLVVIDREGTVRAVRVGLTDAEALDRLVSKWL